jgi:hypothetical protein
MDAKQYETMVTDAENRLKRLRSLYDQWFAGVERIEPQQLRKELDHALMLLRREQTRNTALKFRFNQVVQRYTTYTTYWRRIARQIEEGTYKRDVLRARRLAEQLPPSDPPPARKDGYDLDIDVDIDAAVEGALGDAAKAPLPARATPTPRPLVISPFAMPGGETQPGVPSPEPARSFPPPKPPGLGVPAPVGAAPRPGGPPPPPSAAGLKRPPPPPAAAGVRPAAPAGASAGGSGIADDQMRKIYERYVEARRQNQERTDVKFESVASSVRGMMPKLMQKHAGKNIDFEIVVKDGKVALKPVAR